MATFIDMTQNILSQNTLCFETRTINKEQINVPLQNDATFGILDFKAVTSLDVPNTIEFIFIIDCSGSMSDRCSDGRTKMQHIIHTLKNMIIYFREHPTINVFITVNAFDTKIYKIIRRTNITDENIDEILFNIDKVVPRGSTDIEHALMSTALEINNLKSEYPSHKISHIFMTDGEATTGSNNISELQSLIVGDITNVFVGFGINHDATLLNGISAVGKSSYYFIDKLESAGLVYGEILHSILYKILTDVEINITNGVIYDYKNNTWVEKLQVCDIVSECNRFYSIVSELPDECSVQIKGTQSDERIVILQPTRLENNDLTVHLYRQRTLQILFEVNEFLKKNRKNNDNTFPNIFRNNKNNYDESDNDYEHNKVLIRTKLYDFINEMKKYMFENNLENDKILKNLCDDIYVCYRTFDTKYGNMFCAARQTSQGTQRIYTVSNTDDIFDDNIINQNNIFLRTPTISRHNNMPFLNDLQHEISDFNDTPYLTPHSSDVIFSINTFDNNDNDNDNDIECSQNTMKIN